MKKAVCEVKVMLADLEAVVAQDGRFENPKAVQKNLAMTLGISTRAIRYWFTGTYMPNGYRANLSQYPDNYRRLRRRIYYYTKNYEYYQKETSKSLNSEKPAETALKHVNRTQILDHAVTPKTSLEAVSAGKITQSELKEVCA